MARYPEQCCERVTHIVRHPHWEGDHYLVCPKHLDWAKEQLARSGPVMVVQMHKWEIASGCVYIVAEKILKQRQARALP